MPPASAATPPPSSEITQPAARPSGLVDVQCTHVHVFLAGKGATIRCALLAGHADQHYFPLPYPAPDGRAVEDLAAGPRRFPGAARREVLEAESTGTARYVVALVRVHCARQMLDSAGDVTRVCDSDRELVDTWIAARQAVTALSDLLAARHVQAPS